MQQPAVSITNPEKVVCAKRALLRRSLWWLRAGVTLVLVVFLVWQVRSEIGMLQFHLVRPVRLVLAFGCVVLAVVFSVHQWYILIPPPSRVPFCQLLAHYLLGFFWNNFLPSGLGGDVVRAWALRNDSGHTDSAVSSVLMARLTALWSIVLLAVTTALLCWCHAGWRAAYPSLLLAFGALIVAVGGTAFLMGSPMSTLLRWLPARLRGWHASLRAYGRQATLLFQALAWALVIQLCAVGVNAFTAQALNLAITPGQLLLSMPLINLMTLVPVSLGGFGVREGSYVYFLSLVGVTAPDAVLLALAVFGLLTLVTAAGAGVCMFLRLSSDAHRRGPGESGIC